MLIITTTWVGFEVPYVLNSDATKNMIHEEDAEVNIWCEFT